MRKHFSLILFLCLLSPQIFSQEGKKTKAFVTFELLSPSENSLIVKDNNLNFSFGMGLGLNLRTQFTESSALVYGLEYASTRRNFVFDGFSTFATFAHFKLPIYYQYTLALDQRKKNKINLFLGTKIVVQDGARIGGGGSGNSGKKYEMEKIGGIFPLMTFGFGYDLKFKSNYFIGFEAGYNLGFINAVETTFFHADQFLEYSSNLTHIHFKASFPLNVN
ncbi:MAG TPA: hypothetical protein VKY37_03390 [Brumimicrobium sp.]|nr:hypothetical protein [Brumimicrobium sp.]